MMRFLGILLLGAFFGIGVLKYVNGLPFKVVTVEELKAKDDRIAALEKMLAEKEGTSGGGKAAFKSYEIPLAKDPAKEQVSKLPKSPLTAPFDKKP